MNILIMDAQGGGIGKMLVSEIKKEFPDCIITAVGTNSIATSAMLKTGAEAGATGDVVDVHLFVLNDACSVHEVFVDSDAADIVEVRLSDGNSVYLRF